MQWGLFNSLAHDLLEPFSFLGSIAEALISMIMPIILAVLTIRVVWYGYEVMRGQVNQNVLLELVFRNIKPMLIVGLGLAGGAYASNIIPLVDEIRTSLAALFTHTTAPTTYAAIDQTMDKVMQTFYIMSDDAWENHVKFGVTETDMTGLWMIFCAGLMVFAMLVYCIIAVAQLIVIDIMLKIILAIGPLFIAAFAFTATARFFDSWLSTVLKYTFTAVLIMLAIAVASGLIDNYASKMLANAGFMDYMKVAAYSIAASGLLAYFTLKIPALAGDLLGSIGISLFSPSAAAAPIASAFNNVSKPAREAASNYVGGKASSASTVMKDLVNRTMRQSGTGSISGAANTASQAQFPRSRGTRPTSSSMQTMMDKK